MVNFGRAEIVTVILLCNKPACRNPTETGVDHRVVSALRVFVAPLIVALCWLVGESTLVQTENSEQPLKGLP